MNPRVIQAECREDHRILLRFSNGEQRLFDIRPYLDYPVYQPLRDLAYFLRGRVGHGTVTWPQEEDFCPDTLYLESRPPVAKAA